MNLSFHRRTATPRPRWVAASGLAAVAALLTLASAASASVTPASAADSSASSNPDSCSTQADIDCSIKGFDSDGHTLKFTIGATRGDKPLEIDSGSVKISGAPDGKPAITVDGKPASASGVTVKRQLMLLLDTSKSMLEGGSPNRFQSEIQAANRFIGLVEQSGTGLQVGIVTFGNQAEVILRPTADLSAVRQKINGLDARDLSEKTDLYGAAVQGAGAMDKSSSRSLLMITDGHADPATDAKQFTPQQVQAALGAGGSNSVAFRGVLVGEDPVQDIRKIGTAVVHFDDSATLTNQLQDLVARQVRQQEATLNVSTDVPAAWAGQVAQVTISAKAGGATFSHSFPWPFPSVAVASPAAATPRLVVPQRVTTVPTWVVILALAAVFAALAVLLATATGGLRTGNDGESAVIRRLEIYSVSSAGKPSKVAVTEQTTRLGDSALTRSAVRLMTRLARKGQVDRALDSQLESAGLPLRTAEWMLLHIGIAVTSALLLLLLTGGQVGGLIVGLLLGMAGPWMFLVLSRSRRHSRFLSQLPDTLQLLAGSLAAGYSLPQAMDSVVRESQPPISNEFNRALVEARLGVPPEDALDGIAGRTDSTDFSWIVMAIRIQRDVGGNLAELLSSVASTLRERERLRRQVSALSAEGRLSGLILGALPVVFALYLMITKPEYLAPLLKTQFGLLLLALGAILLIIGGFWMSRVIKVKV